MSKFHILIAVLLHNFFLSFARWCLHSVLYLCITPYTLRPRLRTALIFQPRWDLCKLWYAANNIVGLTRKKATFLS